jgi:chemotaxis protein MotA
VKSSGSLLTVAGLGLGAATVTWAHVSMGGNLALFAQPEAFVVVFGGTVAALLVSYPYATIRSAVAGLFALRDQRAVPLEALVPVFIEYARKARKQGLVAVERDVNRTGDAFLARAVTLSATGLAVNVVREALEIDARVLAERDDDHAEVLEAAAGYAPTLGIVGAVLGLMRVMQHFGVSGGPAGVGDGISAAFVATVFGVGGANLVFLPLATRLRTRARQDALRRSLVIDGVLALRDGNSPGVLEERLAGYLTLDPANPVRPVAEVA